MQNRHTSPNAANLLSKLDFYAGAGKAQTTIHTVDLGGNNKMLPRAS